jgi:hypothetical protein
MQQIRLAMARLAMPRQKGDTMSAKEYSETADQIADRCERLGYAAEAIMWRYLRDAERHLEGHIGDLASSKLALEYAKTWAAAINTTAGTLTR